MFKQVSLLLFVLLSAVIYGFSSYPSRFEVVETANTVVTYSLTLINNTKTDETITLELFSWEAAGDNDMVLLPITENWINIPVKEHFLSADSQKKIDIVLDVPNIKGEKKAQIFVAAKEQKSFFNISKSVPFYLVIKNTEVIDLDLKSFNIKISSDQILFDVELENKGNIHLRPRLELELLHENGNISWLMILDDLPVFPNSFRQYKPDYPKSDFSDVIEIKKLKISYYNTMGQIIEKIIDRTIKL
ncbi:MAG: hypothetical protein PHV30_11470 [Candidatus Margulisbacteria bacterium]|nr:hypothetical protein [Candidatus Margulisiibacteriota bacterium]